MKISIDISLFFGKDGSAFGNVHGQLELVAVPSVGSLVNFVFPLGSTPPLNIDRFSGFLAVKTVRYTPMPCVGAPVSLEMEDVILNDRDTASALMSYLVKGFGLYGDEY